MSLLTTSESQRIDSARERMLRDELADALAEIAVLKAALAVATAPITWDDLLADNRGALPATHTH